MPTKTAPLLFACASTLLATPVLATTTTTDDDADDPPAVAAGSRQPAAPASADPNIDRGFVLPTAMTQPRGSLTYNNYELLLHGLTYGITDNVQASVTVLSPIVTDMPLVAFGAMKGRTAVTDRLHLALQASFSFMHFSDSTDGATVYGAGAGGFASFCLREDCSSLLSASATYQLGREASNGETGHLVVYGGSIVHRITPRIKLLGEITSAAIRNGGESFDNAPALLASYGVRFHTRSLAGDIGFLKPISTDGDEDDDLLLGLPFVNVSYRWN